MIKYKIILVPFPFDDFRKKKVRPAVCLTNEIGDFNHVIVAFISSQISSYQNISDLIIKKDDKDFTVTGLAVNSVIKLHRLITIPTDLIKRQLGQLPVRQQKEVNNKLIALFEL